MSLGDGFPLRERCALKGRQPKQTKLPLIVGGFGRVCTSVARALTTFAAALLVASLPQIVSAQSISVTVNGQPLSLSPGPILRSGRVFVPLRGVFERLGASVVYSAGEINATKAPTTVSLRIGSTQATINNQPQTLDVAPFIIGATTYVPLRFIAQSLGAQVGWDNATSTVSIVTARPVAVVPPRPVPPPVPPRPVPPPPVVRLGAQQPPPGVSIGDRFAVISAQFTQGVNPGSVRVWLDGNNITARSGVSSTGFSYRPPASLDFGTRTVRVAGRGPGGVPFDHSWSFTIIRSGPGPVMRLSISEPVANGVVGRNFTITGNTVANGRVRVTAGAAPSVTGQFNGNTTAGARGNFNITVALATLRGPQPVSVRIVATDPVTSQSTETTLQLRLRF